VKTERPPTVADVTNSIHLHSYHVCLARYSDHSQQMSCYLSYTFQVVDKMVITGSSDCTACAFLLNSYQPPMRFSAHVKTIICMKAVDGLRTYTWEMSSGADPGF